MNDYSKVISLCMDAFRRSNIANVQYMYDVGENTYVAMYEHYDYCDSIKELKQQYRICQLIDEEILPKLDQGIGQSTKDGNLLLSTKMLGLRKRFFALSARRILKNFALYIEQYLSKKVWDKTLSTVESVFYYADLFSISETFNLMRVSLMPSMGKSYIGNLYVAQSVGNNPNLQILRVSYGEKNCVDTTRQTAKIIDSQAFREIFPRYANIPEGKMFKSATVKSLCIVDSENVYNLVATTREGQATGTRAQLVIIDDLLKDESESYALDLHKKMVDRYESTWSSRADDDKQKTLLLGTMWADTDLLNVMYHRANEEDELMPSSRYKYTEITKSGNSVFIGVPALDEDGESTCPLRYSKDFLEKKKKHMSEFLWQCVYQQSPIPPEELSFDWGSLKQWDIPPNESEMTCYAALDPARKGKNYVSMPICCKNEEDRLFYLVDWIYKKKSMDELYSVICDKIVEHQITYLVIENNTDTSLKKVLQDELYEKRKYYGCVIYEQYASVNKEQRIKDNQGYIKNNIVYPKKGLFRENTDIGKAINALVSYSFEYPNKFDDAPDSIALFTSKFVKEKSKQSRVKPLNRRILGI